MRNITDFMGNQKSIKNTGRILNLESAGVTSHPQNMRSIMFIEGILVMRSLMIIITGPGSTKEVEEREGLHLHHHQDLMSVLHLLHRGKESRLPSPVTKIQTLLFSRTSK